MIKFRSESKELHSKHIVVRQQNNFGTLVWYPTCSVGKTFARIANTTTLTEQTINAMISLGYTVTTQAAEVKQWGDA